ncbi:hypothetical protein [Enterobacter cancerogenus]|uniref:hypothetical protein n=1 Tax=Enterobacter cancerogenus TaxID=69218 RepID=UPI0012996186|nr:hypothetical protein [Enterobacter cancerogenus]QGG11057.1 hypothetical protein GH771_20830 [Enterobacter cancerogenus]
MHDEIINQAREILTQRLYRTDALTSPQDTASYLALQLGDREERGVIDSQINEAKAKMHQLNHEQGLY